MIKNIVNKEVISISKSYDTSGHKPYLILTKDYEQYILKTPNNRTDKSSLTKEFLCSLLLNRWKIETPDIASLSLKSSLAESENILKRIDFSYSSSYFGSKLKPDSIDMQNMISGKGKVSFKKIQNILTLIEIGLFDIWIENDDRKPSNNNIILCPANDKLIITAIDHAMTFASLAFDQLNPSNVSFSDNDSIIYTPLGSETINKLKINGSWLAKAREKFYLCISETKLSFQEICNKLPLEFRLSFEEQEKLYNFLFNSERNKKVFDQFSYILNTIIKK